MRISTMSWVVAGAALLTGCATTSVASSPPSSRETTAPTTTLAATTTEATTTTTLPPPPPTTVAPTAPPTTVPPTAPPTTVDPYAVAAFDPPIAPVGRSDGGETSRAQWRLLQLGFWLQEPNGDYEHTTSQAVMAFQKYYGLEADGVLGEQTAAALSSVTERPRGRSDAGTLVEIDKAKQLIYFVQNGVVAWVLNTSTGSEIPYDEPDKNTPDERQIGDSITRNGLHDVYRERAEGWWEGDLGEIYRPKYFSGGEAVHGSNHIPDYPASHGCVRVSVQAMDWIWANNMMPLGIPVWVHGAIPAGPL
jgi:peptidoglycan hydrolase-like protein with peptidoglycan-binding domain